MIDLTSFVADVVALSIALEQQDTSRDGADENDLQVKRCPEAKPGAVAVFLSSRERGTNREGGLLLLLQPLFINGARRYVDPIHHSRTTARHTTTYNPLSRDGRQIYLLGHQGSPVVHRPNPIPEQCRCQEAARTHGA